MFQLGMENLELLPLSFKGTKMGLSSKKRFKPKGKDHLSPFISLYFVMVVYPI